LLATSLVQGWSGEAGATPLRFHATGAAARAVSGHQSRELGWGAAAPLAAELPVVRQLGVQLAFGPMWLSQAQAPADPTLAPQGAASAFCAGAGVRLRPFAAGETDALLSAEGFWLAGSGGAARTAVLTRPMLDAGLGYDFSLSSGVLGLGPALGYTHVFQPDTELRPADANILLVGVHAVFDGGRNARAGSDRDRDGINDLVDRCPDDPEDRDRYQDADGCPDTDNDRDGVVDVIDECPNRAEDADGYHDADGCPEADNDRDRLADGVDRCPNDAEDHDGYEDRDGCPDPDNDRDHIVDFVDQCPNEPETQNGYADDDGCPDEQDVRVVGDEILLDDRVHFWTNSHIIRPESHDLLRRVAKLIHDHPEYVHIEVEGHADSRGPDSFNRPLSERRANSVAEFLRKQGIETGRLSVAGFGEDKPMNQARSQKAWYMNRRVEFLITREVRVDASGHPIRRGDPSQLGGVDVKYEDRATPGAGTGE
jgi:outer membrane protein OmpA-like peptidoglycan-associated protein